MAKKQTDLNRFIKVKKQKRSYTRVKEGKTEIVKAHAQSYNTKPQLTKQQLKRIKEEGAKTIKLSNSNLYDTYNLLKKAESTLEKVNDLNKKEYMNNSKDHAQLELEADIRGAKYGNVGTPEYMNDIVERAESLLKSTKVNEKSVRQWFERQKKEKESEQKPKKVEQKYKIGMGGMPVLDYSEAEKKAKEQAKRLEQKKALKLKDQLKIGDKFKIPLLNGELVSPSKIYSAGKIEPWSAKITKINPKSVNAEIFFPEDLMSYDLMDHKNTTKVANGYIFKKTFPLTSLNKFKEMNL